MKSGHNFHPIVRILKFALLPLWPSPLPSLPDLKNLELRFNFGKIFGTNV